MAVSAAYSMAFVLGNPFPHMRIEITFAILIAFSCALIYMLLRNVTYRAIKARYIVTVLLVLLLLFQSREMNKVFFIEYQSYQRDVFVMHTIIHDLGGREREKPLLFVGLLSEPPLSLSLPRRETAGSTVLNWARHTAYRELVIPRPFMFFEMHGFPITRYSGHVDIYEMRNKITDMPAWPEYGYIMEFDNFIVIRLGLSRIDDL